MNKLELSVRTSLLLAALGAIFLSVGWLLGGSGGMFTALILSLVMNLGAYWFSDKMVLAIHGAKELSAEHPVSRIVRELCERSQTPMPKVYWVQDKAPNAFATGRDPHHAAVAVTEGLLRVLEPHEVRAVLAHELGHVRNRDILISTIVACFASAIMYMAHMAQWAGMLGGRQNGERSINPIALIAVIALAPLATMIVQFAVSRAREYGADEEGARLSGDPEALATALEKISNPKLLKRFQADEEMPDMQPAFSHLYIVNHFSSGSMLSLFSTHPPVKERVERLRRMVRA